MSFGVRGTSDRAVAIQLAPDAGGAALAGTLQPLRLSFASDKAVYPMRLSRSATSPQSVDLYVLADHRMDPTSLPVPGNAPTLQYAGRIDGDYVFTRAATDSDYAQVIYRTRDRGGVTGLALVAAALGGVVLVGALWWRRRHQAK